MNLRYFLLRLGRHFLPSEIARYMLRRGWIIHPGIETLLPEEAVYRYRKALALYGISFSGNRIMIFGYGGNFAAGVEMLKQGAEHVILCDKFAPPDNPRNMALLPGYSDYLMIKRGRVLPDPQFITLVQTDIRTFRVRRDVHPVDVVLSSSVYEHLEKRDLESITRSLAALTHRTGIQLHFIDLRDHFFEYPFEMLTFSEQIWQRWLNPTSNLNRCRMEDYRRLFELSFIHVEIEVLERNKTAFERALPGIRPEFLTGNPAIDAATQIQVLASSPIL